MIKTSSLLRSASLITLLGVLVGCGNSTASSSSSTDSSSLSDPFLHVYALLPNTTVPGSFTIKAFNTSNGNSSVLNSQFGTGVGDNPVLIRTHPNINVFYVLNNGSATVSQYTMDKNGGASFLGTVATPVNPTLIAIHPSGGYVYVVGGAANAPGLIRRFSVTGDGVLDNPLDVATTNNYSTSTDYVKDADFSFAGGTFHLPCVGAIESYPINSDGTLGPAVQSLATAAPTGDAGDNYRDIDVRPGQASLCAVVNAVNGNDKVRSYAVDNGSLSAVQEADTGDLRLGMGCMASNAQYYVGSASNPHMFGFNVDNSTGTLGALATNPMAVGSSISSTFVKLDPTNNFMVSTGGPGDQALVSRFRGSSGEFVGSSSDSQSLTNPSGFDFFAFIF